MRSQFEESYEDNAAAALGVFQTIIRRAIAAWTTEVGRLCFGLENHGIQRGAGIEKWDGAQRKGNARRAMSVMI
jgi:hypothetical protein